jgi:hypothetical protein
MQDKLVQNVAELNELVAQKAQRFARLKKVLNEFSSISDAMAIIFIMFGGIIAVGRSTKLLGIVIIVAGFLLLVKRCEKLSKS